MIPLKYNITPENKKLISLRNIASINIIILENQ